MFASSSLCFFYDSSLESATTPEVVLPTPQLSWKRNDRHKFDASLRRKRGARLGCWDSKLNCSTFSVHTYPYCLLGAASCSAASVPTCWPAESSVVFQFLPDCPHFRCQQGPSLRLQSIEILMFTRLPAANNGDTRRHYVARWLTSITNVVVVVARNRRTRLLSTLFTGCHIILC